MARYIDKVECAELISEKLNISLGDLVDIFAEIPTADVVPKSEYDAVVSAIDNSTKEFLKLHDDYQEAKREIDKWMGRCRDWHEVAEEKSKLVSEIFEEIENNYADFLFDGYRNIVVLTEKDFAELKKKYTEDKT